MIKLFLILPISNVEIERTFSSYGYLKNKLRNCLLDEKTNDLLPLYIFKKISDQKEFKQKYLERWIKRWV